MALFLDLPAEEWVFFVFILVTLLIFTGQADSYSGHWFVNGVGQIQLWPVENILIPLASAGPLFGALAALLFFAYFTKLTEWFTIGFGAVIIFGLIAIILGV
jgi:hypothetical protein